MACALCHHVLPAGESRCPGCPEAGGARVRAGLRVVTVVAVRLVGLSRLAEAAPEQAGDLQGAVGALWLEHGGRIGESAESGDGVDDAVVLFEDGGALRDSVTQALAAATEARAFVRNAATRAWRETGVALELRVGIATGYALLDEPEHQLLAGPSLAVARRLAHAAGPDDVLVDEGCARVVGDSLALLSEDALAGPWGVSLPVWRVDVEALPRVAPRPRTRPGGRRALFGRDDELSALRSLFETATEQPALRRAAIVGAPGSGRSRVMREFVDKLRGAYTDLMVAEAALSARGGATEPFQLLVSLVGSLLGTAGGAPETDIAAATDALLDELAEHEPRLRDSYLRARLLHLAGVRERGEGTLADPEHAEELTHAAVAALLGAATAAGPLLVVLDDLDDATDAERRALARVCLQLRRRPAMIVATAQSAPKGWGEGDRVIDLPPLGDDAVRVTVDRILGRRDALPRTISDEIAAITGGQPLFVEETVHALLDAGLLEEDAASGTWRLTSGGVPSGFPDTLPGLLVARLDLMPEGDAELLRLAAVAGDRFWLGLVDELSSSRAALVLRRLEERGWIARTYDEPLDGQVGYCFVHRATREVLAAEVPPDDARRLHVQVARWLAVHAGDRFEAWLPAVAWHFAQAGEAVHAASYHLQAGRWASTQGDLGLACAQLDHARRLAPDRDASMRASLALGEVNLRRFDYRASEEVLGGVLTWAEERHDHRDVLRCVVLLAAAASGLRRFDRARRLVARGLELARSLGVVREEASLLLEQARAALSEGDEAGARDAIARCRAIRTDLGDDLGGAWAAVQAGRILLQSGDLAAASVAYREARDLARSLSHELLDARAAQGLAWVRFVRGDAESADMVLAEIEPVFRGLGLDRLAVRALVGRALIALEQRRWADAANAAADALAHCEKRPDAMLVALARATVGHVYATVETGRHKMKARELSRNAIRFARVNRREHLETAFQTTIERGGAPRLYRGLIALFLAEYLATVDPGAELRTVAQLTAAEALEPFGETTFGARAEALDA